MSRTFQVDKDSLVLQLEEKRREVEKKENNTFYKFLSLLFSREREGGDVNRNMLFTALL